MINSKEEEQNKKNENEINLTILLDALGIESLRTESDNMRSNKSHTE